MAKILLAEDEQFIRELYEKVLREAGLEVEAVADGEQALAKAQTGGYDLILLDIVMPKKDGISVLKELKANPPQTPNKKIVMLTVMDTDDIIKAAFKEGAHGYLIKPALTPPQVVEEAKKFLTPE